MNQESCAALLSKLSQLMDYKDKNPGVSFRWLLTATFRDSKRFQGSLAKSVGVCRWPVICAVLLWFGHKCLFGVYLMEV